MRNVILLQQSLKIKLLNLIQMQFITMVDIHLTQTCKVTVEMDEKFPGVLGTCADISCN
jgi:hypothetical protein